MRTSFLALLTAGTCACSAHAQLLGPAPYTSFSDSPFSGVVFPGYFHLENFEDGLANTPGLTASAGSANSPGPATDSVDADDGTIDGLGTAGRPWYSSGGVNAMRFSFDAGVLAAFPTHAGIVWTDVGNVPGGSFGVSEVIFEAFGPTGLSLGTTGPITLGDGSINGATPEDRFFGIISLGGISAIELRMPASGDWEVDHVQYGRVPAPTSLLALGVPLLALRRRRLR